MTDISQTTLQQRASSSKASPALQHKSAAKSIWKSAMKSSRKSENLKNLSNATDKFLNLQDIEEFCHKGVIMPHVLDQISILLSSKNILLR